MTQSTLFSLRSWREQAQRIFKAHSSHWEYSRKRRPVTKMQNKHVRVRSILSIIVVFSAIIAVSAVIEVQRFAHASINYVSSGNGSQQNVSAVVTFYGYNDNSGTTENQYG